MGSFHTPIQIADHEEQNAERTLGIKRETVYVWMEKINMPAQKVKCLWKFNFSKVETGYVPGRPE